MTDRELLELAAKAAGIDARRLPHAWPERFDDDQWNPIIDNSDSFRLAVKLGMMVDATPIGDYIQVGFDAGDNLVEEHVGSDSYAATRRAIVRAAAEIGKAMP